MTRSRTLADRYAQEDAVWARLKKDLGNRLPDDAREDGLIAGMIRTHLLPSDSPEYVDYSRLLVGIPRQLWPDRASTLKRPKKAGRKQVRTKDASLRIWALSTVLARHAAEDERVKWFRQEVLGGKLLRTDEVDDWIKAQKKEDEAVKRPSHRLNGIPVEGGRFKLGPRGATISPPLVVSELGPGMGSEFKLLDYAVPDKDWVQHVPVAYGGALDRLRSLSESLAKHYRWIEAQATVFVLAGAVPVVENLSVRIEPGALNPQRPISSLAQIVLRIDPTVSPDVVKRAYQRARQRLAGKKKHRDLTEPQLRLAVFVAEQQPVEPEEFTPEHLKAWVAELPPGQVPPRLDNFRRTCRTALERLLRPYSLRNLLPGKRG